VTGIARNLPLTLTFHYLNLKLANDRVQMNGALQSEALKNGGAPVICRRRQRRHGRRGVGV